MAHLLAAWEKVNPEFGLVLAAGSPDEPGIGKEVSDAISKLKGSRKNIWWFEKMLPQDEVISLLSSADLFICPSIYEPLGIVNLEAMACETAVVASAVGGIPEVVLDGVTGQLVPYTPDDADAFVLTFAQPVQRKIVYRDRTMQAIGMRQQQRFAITESDYDDE